MKRRSVQVRLTLWYTLLMAGMAGLLLVFLLVISGAVSRQTAMDQLETTLRENLSQVSLGDDGSLQLGEDFSFYQQYVPGLFFFLGTGDTPQLHAPDFTFDDEAVLPRGVEFLKKLLMLP